MCANDGDTHNSPNEQVEAKFPVVVERCPLIDYFGGAGKYRGGLGIESVVRARSISWSTRRPTVRIVRRGASPAGRATGNHIHVRVDGQWKTDQPNAKMLVTALKPGDAFRLRSGGGGGYGSPLERHRGRAERRAAGLRLGRGGREVYGVVIDAGRLR